MIDAGTNMDARLVSCFKHSLINECDNDCLAAVVTAHQTHEEKDLF